MIKWYDLGLMYLISSIVLCSINRFYKIMPPVTKAGWIVFLVIIGINMVVWHGGLSAYLGFEYTLNQMAHSVIAMAIQVILYHVIFKPYFLDDPRHSL
jgi:hypothetical protein